MAAHAILSASASSRWLACPPSARIALKYPNKSTIYAEEGTKAHALAERTLNDYLRRGCASAEINADDSADAELKNAVQEYVDICIEKIVAAKQSSPDAQICIEQRLDFSPWVPEGFGTGDMCIISDECLEIVDLKYGKGVPVSAEDNTQMRLYALGALNTFGVLYGFDTVRMTIVQPRLDSVSTDEMSVEDLFAWGESIKPTAALAYRGGGEMHAGVHCRFCPARCTCRSLAEYELELVKDDFTSPVELEDWETSEIVCRAKEIISWLRDVEEFALEQAVSFGKSWPGLKLVEGRSNRKITDTVAVAETLQEEGYTSDDLYKPQELQTLTALEKLVGKKRLAQLIGEYVEKPAGKPTLVPESDKRPAITITDDFDDSLID